VGQHYLLYWKPETADRVKGAGGPLRYAASGQFNRLAAGDTVWAVTCRDGELRLLGRVVVGRVVGRAEAAAALDTEELWDADWYALAEPGTEQPVREVTIQHLAPDLRFVSPGETDRLALARGRVNAQQLQTMRELSEESGALLRRRWEGTDYPRAWVVKAYGEERSHGGNLGYADDLRTCYCYDSLVPNCRQVDVGDVLLIRGKRALRGVARVRDIDSWEDEKDLQKCPTCGGAKISHRKTLGSYVCKRQECGVTFPEPRKETVSCVRFVASYEGAVRLWEEDVPVNSEMIREASPKYNRQNAIVPIDMARLHGDAWRQVRKAVAELLGSPQPEGAGSGSARATGAAVEAEEGEILYSRHRRRERNRRLVRLKKAEVLRSTGKLACEACTFDFAAFYGEELGAGLAECHHRAPIGELKGKTRTRLEHLAIVCANCHRVLHRRQARGFTVEDLRRHLARRGTEPGGG
jgi:hypothetical protein